MEIVTLQQVTQIALDIPRFIEYSLVLLLVGFVVGKIRNGGITMLNIHISYGVTDDCKNLEESYGEICVQCNKCGRFDEEEGESEVDNGNDD